MKFKEKILNYYHHLENLRKLYYYGVRTIELITKNELIIKHKFTVNDYPIPAHCIPQLSKLSEDIFMKYSYDSCFGISVITIKYNEDIATDIIEYFNDILKDMDDDEKKYLNI